MLDPSDEQMVAASSTVPPSPSATVTLSDPPLRQSPPPGIAATKLGEADLRGFEWRFLYRLAHQELLTLRGHTGAVNSVAYSPDGKRLATASRDATVRVWDAETSKELMRLEGHTPDLNSGVYSISFGADGTRLASATGREIKIWDAHSGKEMQSISGRFDCMAYSRDGKLVASAGYRGSPDKLLPEVKVWDAETGKELRQWDWQVRYFDSMDLSPDGQRLICTAGNQAIKLWDTQTGKELQSKSANVAHVAYSPDGKLIAACYDDHAELWDSETLLTRKSFKGAGESAAFSSDGKLLAVPTYKDTTTIWEIETGQELLTIKGAVELVAFSPDGSRLASVSPDYTVKVWDARNSRENLTFKGAGGHGIAFSPDGLSISSGSLDGIVKVWDPRTGQLKRELRGHTAPVHIVAYSPDGKRLATAGYGRSNSGGGWGTQRGDKTEVKMWNAQNGELLFGLEIPPRPSNFQTARVFFSRDGKQIISPGDDEVQVWDADTGKELPALKRWGISSPDGRLMAAGSWYRRDARNPVHIDVWEAETGKVLFTLMHGSGPLSLAFSHDSKRLATSAANVANGANPDEKWTAKIWDTQTGREVLSLPFGRTGYLAPVAFSPDGERLASSGGEGVRVWDVLTGEELLTLKGADSSPAASLAFSPDGNLLAIGSYNQTIRIWDATPLPEKP